MESREKPRFNSHLSRILLALGAFAVYLAAFIFFRGLGPLWSSSLILIPIAAFAILFGIKGGAALGVLSFPLSRLIFHLFQRPPMTDPKDIVMGIAVSLFFGLLLGYLRDTTLRYKRTSEELARAISEVKRLSGLLPICAHCNKVRDDEGYWRRVEDYVSAHSEVEFTHGLCPDCMKELYPELVMMYAEKSGYESPSRRQ
ncbi:MAG: hypothetical protein JXQ30_15030 [Spirochaetes bacterium]|nr:hypothetical protein [Spirochaetota bacterium]